MDFQAFALSRERPYSGKLQDQKALDRAVTTRLGTGPWTQKGRVRQQGTAARMR